MPKTTDKKSKKPVPVESSSSDSSDSEEEVVQPVKKAKVTATKVVAKKVESSSSESSSSEDEAPAKKAPVAAKKKAAESSSSEDSSSEEEAPKKAAAKPVVKKAAAKKAESSSSESSSSEDEAPAKKAPVATKKRAAESSSSDSSSDEEEEVKPAAKKPKVETAAAATPSAEHKIYVKGLPWKAADYEVKDFFKGCGNIVSVDLPVDETGRSSGTAFVVFEQRSGLDAAIELDGQVWPDTERWLKIQEAKAFTPRGGGEPGAKPEGCNTVFCGNLSWDVEEQTLRDLFSSCGEITRVRFATNPDTGEFKGFGHVEFADGDSTDAAVAFSGTDVQGRAIRVDYAPPRNRESFGGGGRGGRGDGGRSPGGRGGRGRGRGGASPFGGRGGGFNANKGTISLNAAGSGNKKTTFD